MVEPSHKHLSIKTQCELLSISRSGWHDDPKCEAPLTLKVMRLIDEQYLFTPYYGSRQMARLVGRQRFAVERHRVRQLMSLMGLHAIIRNRARASLTRPIGIIQYLLPNLAIQKANQVWCTDITYIPINLDFCFW
ncbi:IS3 family transposase [Nitrospira sp. T9]|uniref:IS3 family transposase n=1 Tax=unclassified Nitrospira TaxID=2652172 RepID=UPI003F95A063